MRYSSSTASLLSHAQMIPRTLFVLRLAGGDALGLIDYLALHRASLFVAVMRDDVEAFKAQVRAEYALPIREETRVYVPPSSCDETYH